MVEIEARCPRCGLVQISADRWRMVVYPERPASSYCCFQCDCDQQVVLPATPRVIAALWYLVPSVMERLPAEALEEHVGDALNEDDLIDFMIELNELP